MIKPENYELKKQKVIEEFSRLKKQKNISLDKETTNLFRYRNQGNAHKLSVRDFNGVISVNSGTIDVEGMAMYETIVEKVLPYGVMPAVVPQLKTITLGGAASGGGIESSSFRHGFVHETIEAMEILTGRGDIVTCSRDKNPDLFFGFPNSYGTLGYALKLTAATIPVKPFVALEHSSYGHCHGFFNDLEKICQSCDIDFVDGVIFHENEMYITTGRFVDEAPFTNDYTYLKVYYKSIFGRDEDYLTAHDYLWRWDSDWFWNSKHFFMQNPLMRMMAGRKRLNSQFYMQLKNFFHEHPFLSSLFAGNKRKESVIQDVQIPIGSCRAFLEFFNREIGITPIWICPAKSPQQDVFSLYPADSKTLYVNFGFWDVVPTVYPEGHYNKLVERKVKELNGKKSLYSDSFYTEDEFWKLYNGEEYRKLKQTYDPESIFPNLYEKCVLKK